LLREPITFPKAIGAAIILAGIYLVARAEARGMPRVAAAD
jgi:drug/metabolite transporter (DMT)-like permease